MDNSLSVLVRDIGDIKRLLCALTDRIDSLESKLEKKNG